MTLPTDQPPSDPRRHAQTSIGGVQYDANFYPGFARTITIDNGVESGPLYAQDPNDPFVLPAGADKPWPYSFFEIASAEPWSLSFQLNDPDEVVASIQLTLRPAGSKAAARAQKTAAARSGGAAPAGTASVSVDGQVTVTIQNDPVVCPPHCIPPTL